MEVKLIPAKNQKFDIGRTINFTKCDCEKCDFMHCPKNNYALKMVQKKYSVKEFFYENKTEIMKMHSLCDYLNYDAVVDFMDACVGSFPKGTYWRTDGIDCINTIYLCVQNRSKYGEDFIDRACIDLFYDTFKVGCFTGCTDAQERLAKKISSLFKELNELFKIEKNKQ